MQPKRGRSGQTIDFPQKVHRQPSGSAPKNTPTWSADVLRTRSVRKKTGLIVESL